MYFGIREKGRLIGGRKGCNGACVDLVTIWERGGFMAFKINVKEEVGQ